MLFIVFASTLCKGDDRIASPDGERFAHFSMCSVANPCTPEVVISTRDGREIHRFKVMADNEPCASIEGLEWASNRAVGAVCHVNPSLNHYYEVDIASGKALREYMGYKFYRSPDRKLLAHVGLIVHFASPWQQSESLQIGNMIVYPLPPGMKPVDPKGLDRPPEVVTERGLVFSGVHSFQGGFVWSPESRWVGFVDCLVDYRLRNHSAKAWDEGGKQENRRCFAGAIGLDGTVHWKRIDLPLEQVVTMKWTDVNTLVILAAGNHREFTDSGLNRV